MGARVSIQGKQVERMEYMGIPVVTLRQIDSVHGKSKPTAEKVFSRNRRHFSESKDYFLAKPQNGQNVGFKIPNRGLLLFTESGYLMIVKSFTDELSWKVQRDLVNNYFRMKDTTVLANNDLRGEVQALRAELQEMKRLVTSTMNSVRGKTHQVKPENRNFLYNRFLELYDGRMSLRMWKEITGCTVHNSVLATAFYQNMMPGERSLAIIMKHLHYTNKEIAEKLIELGIDKGLAAILA